MKVEKIDFISRQHGRWCVVAVMGRLDRTNAAEAGKEYAIYCGNGFVKEVLEDSSMDMLIKVCATLDEVG